MQHITITIDTFTKVACMQIATHLVEERDLLVDKEGVGNPDQFDVLCANLKILTY